MRCSVKNCKNKYDLYEANNISIFKFPRNKQLRAQWLQFCGKSDPLSAYWGVCQDHFSNKDIIGKVQRDLGIPRHLRLEEGAVPTIANGVTDSINTKNVAKTNENSVANKIEVVIRSIWEHRNYCKQIKSLVRDADGNVYVIENDHNYANITSCPTAKPIQKQKLAAVVSDHSTETKRTKNSHNSANVANCPTANPLEVQKLVDTIRDRIAETKIKLNGNNYSDIASCHNGKSIAELTLVTDKIDLSTEFERKTNWDGHVGVVNCPNVEPLQEQKLVAAVNGLSAKCSTEIEKLNVELKALRHKNEELVAALYNKDVDYDCLIHTNFINK